MEKYISIIANELSIKHEQVENTLELLAEGATVPFISRYRKEATGSLDEVAITHIRDRMEKLEEIDKRRDAILKSMEEQGVLTGELEKQIEEAESLTELEDIYLPYKPKRKTRATMARDKGLEPLAKILMKQQEMQVEKAASSFLNEEVESVEDALQGARDIIAEWVNENQRARKTVRYHFDRSGVITSKLVKGKEEANQLL